MTREIGSIFKDDDKTIRVIKKVEVIKANKPTIREEIIRGRKLIICTNKEDYEILKRKKQLWHI